MEESRILKGAIDWDGASIFKLESEIHLNLQIMNLNLWCFEKRQALVKESESRWQLKWGSVAKMVVYWRGGEFTGRGHEFTGGVGLFTSRR